MKFTFTNTLITTLFLSGTLSAQFVGGGGTSAPARADKTDAGPWKNRTYIYLSPSMPIGAWNKEFDQNATLTDAYNNNTGFGAKTGFSFDFGNNFYLKKLRLPENMGIAINASYLNIGMNNFDWSNESTTVDFDHSRFWYFGFKIGGQFSYMLMENMFVDAYFNLCPQFISIPDSYSTHSNSTYAYDWTCYPNGVDFATRKNIGVNFRYKVFTVGLDLMMGAVKSSVHITTINNKTGVIVYDEITPIKFRPNTLQLRLGFTI